MRAYVVAGVMFMALGSSGCRRVIDADAKWDPTGLAGRTGYVAVGIYTPSVTWQRLVRGSAQATANQATARTVDDQAVIVVQNSLTGDVRACGDMTGYCVGMNPWAQRPGQLTPVSLTDHQPTEAEQAAKQQAADDKVAKRQAALMATLKRAAHRRRHYDRG